MGKRARSGSVGSASAKKRRRMGNRYYARKVYRPTYVRPGYGAIGRTPGGGVIGEMKYFDTFVDQVQIPGSNAAWLNTTIDPSTYNTLCVPVVGAGYNQRIGKEIKVLKIKIRGQIKANETQIATGSFNGYSVRFGVFQDMQTNATQANASLVMSPTPTDEGAPYTFQNIDNFGRFKVLKDKIVTLQDPNLIGAAPTIGQNGLTKTFKMSIKFRQPVNIRFNQANGGTIADIIDNSFHVFANSNYISGGAGEPRITYLCRVCYKE